MCDLYSWGILKHDIPSKNLHKDDILFLTDAEAEAMISKNPDNEYASSFQNYVGHRAIAKYYGINESDLIHYESYICVPEKLAAEINAGHCKKLAAAVAAHSSVDYDTYADAPAWRYMTPIFPGMMARSTRYRDTPCNVPIDHPAWKIFFAKLNEAARNLSEYAADREKRHIRSAVRLIHKVIKGGTFEITHTSYYYYSIAESINARIMWRRHEVLSNALRNLDTAMTSSLDVPSEEA